ncbi:hypothetical protein AVEN_24595-1 [Araneus ventricosus]|uniref:Uncharacterized protein n=1 Tax=Araneus ventricosus TaxID=182803 RepID=A0A4Y2FAH3_ARAVE|nr:hypothetical protein AVEN_24595-1 [Araneus ventricosus]
MPSIGWIFSEIVFRSWNPIAPKPKLYHYSTAVLEHITSIIAKTFAPHSTNFRTTPASECLAPMYDLTCNIPSTRRIFSEIVFRSWNPAVPTPRPYH